MINLNQLSENCFHSHFLPTSLLQFLCNIVKHESKVLTECSADERMKREVKERKNKNERKNGSLPSSFIHSFPLPMRVKAHDDEMDGLRTKASCC